MTDPVVAVGALSALDDPVVFADVRWYLGEPERGHAAYEIGHIPGAVYIDLEAHLSSSDGPGRHPLPVREEFAARLSRLGIGDGDTVVAYDDRGGAVAARLWWMLRDIGHEAFVLDGGIQAWSAAGHTLAAGVESRDPAHLTVRQGPTREIDREGLRRQLGEVALLDARAPERYRGEEEPVDPVAGHIPTAMSADLNLNLDEDLRFRSAGVLRARFGSLGATPGRDTVVYCGSGVTACHNALALVRAGFPEPILYPGSWSDWCTSGGEVATGSEPGLPGDDRPIIRS
jgi:thiosulfate/3-mercaptopyruvate sulfurtransferase